MAEQPLNIQELDNRTYIGPAKTGDNIDARRVALYGYNSSSSQWSRLQVDPNGFLQSSSATYAIQTDAATTSGLTYVGKAPVGSSTSSSVWQIQLINQQTSNEIQITWAGGSSSFTNQWTQRTSYTYS